MIVIFFAILENGHIAVSWLYFFEFNLKKMANFVTHPRSAHVAKYFFFFFYHRDLKNNFFLKISNTFLLFQRTIAKIKFEIKFCYFFFSFFKNHSTWILFVKVKPCLKIRQLLNKFWKNYLGVKNVMKLLL